MIWVDCLYVLYIVGICVVDLLYMIFRYLCRRVVYMLYMFGIFLLVYLFVLCVSGCSANMFYMFSIYIACMCVRCKVRTIVVYLEPSFGS